ncbi:MAG TPA: sugar phosphate isomerase/epimerase family protein [Planctomycetota bacterium]|nr:sugar phosphate isomerase/epimerase family protein [Planctomycetota bacterium]
MLSMTTDYATVSTGCPEPYLRRIAEAGFSHVHWCHHWNTDFLYADAEVEQIGRWLADFGLALTDLHASAGVEKGWCSAREYERLAGIELVTNRIAMTARLGSDVVILHLPFEPEGSGDREAYWARVRRSFDDLAPFARGQGVRIALENSSKDNFDALERVFALYGPDVVGLCYDSGHGNVAGNGLDRLERVRGRLLSVHLHDNDGTGDQHKLVFDGTTDWPRLARLIASSPYRKPLSFESNMGSYPKGSDEVAFLCRALASGAALARLLEREELAELR